MTFSVLALHIVLLRYRLPYVSKLGLLFPMKNHVNVHIIQDWHKSFKRGFLNLTERSSFLWHFILWELIFAEQGQSAKSAKIRTCKTFMRHDSLISKCTLINIFYINWEILLN